MSSSAASIAYKKIKRISYALFISSFIYIAVGFSTIFWPSTDATLIFNETHIGGTRGKYHPKAGYTYAVSVSVNDVQYEYSVKGKAYLNKLLCICFPVGIDINTNKGTASYLPGSPAFSVLVPGPYFDIPFVFVTIGAGLIAFGRFINEHG